MTTPSRTVRVFLSSTFRDFAEERDLLVRKVFPELRRKCRERLVELVDVDLRWGITEEEAQQGKVLPICLAEIDRSRPFFMGFIGERYGWIPEPEKYDLSLIMEQPWLDEHRGGKSVTELEMLHGVLNNPAMEDRAFFYFRDPAWSQKKGGAYLSEGSAEKEKLEALKDRIRQSGFPVVEDYPTPEALAEQVKKDLWNLIDEAFPESEVPDALAQERMRHEAYSATRRRLYLGGEKYFQFLDAAMKAKAFKPVLVSGQSGGGKSSLLANWTARWSKTHPKTALILHHLGCGADAADPVRMATRLMQEIARITGDEFKPESDPDKMLEKLPESLAIASAWAEREKRELLIVLDGLDKVSERQHLRWFPAHLPPKVKLLASCLDGEVLEAAKRRLGWSELKLKPFTRTEQTRFIKEYLGRYRKSLTPPQRKSLQSHPLCGNPLFLLTVLEELRVFGVHEKLQERLQVLLSPPASKGKDEEPTVDDVFEHVLARVEEDLGKKTVQSALEAIWASRSGLFQEELLSIAKLAPAQWAAIQIALDESLYDSGGKISFGHDYLRKAVEDRYGLTGKVKNEVHKKIAEWFGEQKINKRIAVELPWQWRQCEDRKRLTECLIDNKVFAHLHKQFELELLGYWMWAEIDINSSYATVWPAWDEKLQDNERHTVPLHLCSFLLNTGIYSDFAANLYQISLDRREKHLGYTHPDTLETVSGLGRFLKAKGDLSGAEIHLRRALEGREKTLGPQNAETLMSLNNLGLLLQAKGDYQSAQAFFQRALTGQEKVLGISHLDTLMTVNNLGNNYFLQCNYTEAQLFLQRSLEGISKSCGPMHPMTCKSLLALGNVYCSIGEHSKGEELFREAIRRQCSMLGENHPDTLMSNLNLGVLYYLKGDRGKAEKSTRDALQRCRFVLGNEHPETLRAIKNLSQFLPNDSEEILVLSNEVYELNFRKFGGEHQETLHCIMNIGNIHYANHNYPNAEFNFRRAFNGLKTTLGLEHSYTIEAANNLALTLQKNNKNEEAGNLLSELLESCKVKLGVNHLTYLLVSNNIAVYYLNTGEYDKAEMYYKEALDGRKKILGFHHEDTKLTADNLMRVLNIQGRHDEADEIKNIYLK